MTPFLCGIAKPHLVIGLRSLEGGSAFDLKGLEV
jgi:hypothetical protein